MSRVAPSPIDDLNPPHDDGDDAHARALFALESHERFLTDELVGSLDAPPTDVECLETGAVLVDRELPLPDVPQRRLSVSSDIDNLGEEDKSLAQPKRVLTEWDVTAMGIGAIIGAGIFVLTGQAAAEYAGPAIVISFIFSGFCCSLAALCYAELAAMIPVAGSAYTYAYATLGKEVGWLIGWDLMLEYLFGAATVAVGWSGYFVNFLQDLHIFLPHAISDSPFAFHPDVGWSTTGAVLNLPAVLLCVAVTVLLYRGARMSALVNNAVVVIKIVVLILFILCGAFFINSDNYHPFIPPSTEPFVFGWGGIFRASGVIFFAYIGFDTVSSLAHETLNPQRAIPVGIIASLSVCTVLYVLVGLVMTGMVNYTELASPSPVAVAIDAAGPKLYWLRPIVKLGALAGLSSVVLVSIMGQTRVFYAMARDKMLPDMYCSVHPRFGSPHHATVITGAACAVTAGLLPVEVLGEMVSIGTLFAFVVVSVGVLVLRHTHRTVPRPFRVPFSPYVPCLGIACFLVEMVSLPFATWIRLFIWMAAGGLIFYFYSRDRIKEFPDSVADHNSELMRDAHHITVAEEQRLRMLEHKLGEDEQRRYQLEPERHSSEDSREL
eukprot:gnl/Spiro4/26659_TR13249_c0_g1_i1.p1 gnl/Spiro4/26659_TR13249_c0_g1~~gnl/Spiro4/26659_TR13249_c0_g1_i1.p1  ORF type:complete len:607 (+),score=252.96 gnl/Spiro4/26659_TR13249_c0_g1_i1:97-1917(+)